MKTIIFDIDGTLTDMWPIEKSVLLSILGKNKEVDIETLHNLGVKDTYTIFCMVAERKISKRRYTELYNRNFSKLENCNFLPQPVEYPLVYWIKDNRDKYRFLYVTGGQRLETLYVLRLLKLIIHFDINNSIDKSNYIFSKKTGLPFKKIKKKFDECFLITDSEDDCRGAKLANLTYLLIKSKQKSFRDVNF